MNKFAHVSFEFNTIEPPINPLGSTVEVICDEQQNPIGFRKNVEELKSFNYDLKIFEEKYNLLIITGGKIGLMNAT